MSRFVDHAQKFAGYPVIEWKAGQDPFANGTEIAIAIRTDWDENDGDDQAWVVKFNALLNVERLSELPALVIGMWSYEESSEFIVNALVEHKDKLASLKALFIGDIVSEENEISWIKQGDLSPLWGAFPQLEHLTIRGSDGLSLGEMKLHHLKSLQIESGGLPAEVVRSVGKAELPSLEKLVIWLGTDNYGATTTIADLTPFYDGATMPKLKHLGLCNSDLQDQIAEFISTAPILKQLDVLELSMGVLTDDGALALVTSPYIRNLKVLDIQYHYCSDAMVRKLKELEKEGVKVDASEPQEEESDWRFVAVGE